MRVSPAGGPVQSVGPRGVAQLVVHRSPKPGVAGSSPVSPAGPRRVGVARQELFDPEHADRGRVPWPAGRQSANAVRDAFAPIDERSVKPYVPWLNQFPRNLQRGAIGREREAAADRDAAYAHRGQLRHSWRARSGEYVDGKLRRSQQLAQFFWAVERRRVQHVGAGFCVGLKARDRVAQVRVPTEVVLGAGGQHQLHVPGMCRFGGRGDALGRLTDVVQPLFARVPVLDRAAGEPGVEREADGVCDAGSVHGEAVLEIGRDGQLAGAHNRCGVCERLLAGDAVVEAPEARGVAAAGGRQRVKPERCQQLRRTTSQALASSSGPSARCSSRKRIAFSACVAIR